MICTSIMSERIYPLMNSFLHDQAHLEEDKTFVLLDDDDDDEAQGDTILDEEGTDTVDPDIAGYMSEMLMMMFDVHTQCKGSLKQPSRQLS